jgi:hypothetical protein
VRAVPLPGLAVDPPSRRARVFGATVGVIAAAAATAGVLSGFGANVERHAAVTHRAPAVAKFDDGVVQGMPLQRATCANWRHASASDRNEILNGLASTVGGASTTGGYGTTLSATDGAALFDRQCATPETRHFILYVIYVRAAGLRGTP